MIDVLKMPETKKISEPLACVVGFGVSTAGFANYDLWARSGLWPVFIYPESMVFTFLYWWLISQKHGIYTQWTIT